MENETVDGKPEWLEHLSVLSVQPGDILVVRTRQMLSYKTVEWITEKLRALFPEHRVLILENDMELGVVRRGETGLLRQWSR